jgi:glutamyl-tRNA reductase
MLISLGLDFRHARLEVRERFHLQDHDVPRVCDALVAIGFEEIVLTRTCNRIEAYGWWPAPRASEIDFGREISRAWAGDDGPGAELLRASARLREGKDAVRHLFRVAAGLESQILGDVHILGQLRRAFRDAVGARSVGSHLHRLFETALRVGKRVKKETRLVSTQNSVGSHAARRAAARFGGVVGRSCVVIGCGKSGTHAARALAQLGATQLTIVNRTVERAEALARELGGARAVGLDALCDVVAGADIAIVATGAQEPVLRAAALRDARARIGSDRPLLVVDVSVPRNVELSVATLLKVELVDLDALRLETAEVEKFRLQAIPEAEARVEDGLGEFMHWLELQSARRALRPLHETLSAICRREVSYLAGASPLAERTADRIVASVMARPMAALRAASLRGETLEHALGALGVLFEEVRPTASPTRSLDGAFSRQVLPSLG